MALLGIEPHDSSVVQPLAGHYTDCLIALSAFLKYVKILCLVSYRNACQGMWPSGIPNVSHTLVRRAHCCISAFECISCFSPS